MIDFPLSPGKIVTIRKNGQKIPSNYKYDLTLSTELTLNFNSSFDYLLSQDNPAATALLVGSQLVSSATNSNFSFTGRFKEMGYQIWKGTEPVQFTFEVMLNMYTSGEEDVLNPAKELISLCLPSDGDSSQKQFGLVAPGPSIVAATADEKGNTLFEMDPGKKYSITVGAFYLSNVIITSVEPTFSAEVDDRGYPIWCSLKIDAKSLSTATTNIVNGFGSAYQKRD